MKRHVLVTMREHGLRRILAGALRTAGHVVAEAFDEPDMRSELENAERPFDVVVRDARRYPDATLNDVVRLRNAGIRTPAIFFVSQVTEGYIAEAHRLGVALLTLPLKSADLFCALEGVPDVVIRAQNESAAPGGTADHVPTAADYVSMSP